jgi:hypothetical protein
MNPQGIDVIQSGRVQAFVAISEAKRVQCSRARSMNYEILGLEITTL